MMLDVGRWWEDAQAQADICTPLGTRTKGKHHHPLANTGQTESGPQIHCNHDGKMLGVDLVVDWMTREREMPRG